MHKSMKKTWIWLLIIVVIFVFLRIIVSSNSPKEYPAYLSTSPSPTGVKAFYTYVEDEIESVERWNHAPDLLKKDKNQLLLMIGPALISDQTIMNDYIDFIEAGNTVLIFKRNLEGMFDIRTNVVLSNEEAVVEDSRDGARYEATMFSQSRIIPKQEDDVLLEDDVGVIAIKREIGEGNLIAANAPDWLTNQHILTDDNLELVFGLMEEESWQTILFDEFAHQSSQTKSFTNVYPMWLLVGGLQLILVTLLWLLYKGKRFGPIRVPRDAYVRYSDERITALAAWYKRGSVYRESLQSQAEYVRLILREKWGISYQKEWKDIREPLLQKVKQMEADELTNVVNQISAVLHKENMTKQEYLLWSKRIDRLRKEVEEG